MARRDDIEWSVLFSYDENSPTGLRWRDEYRQGRNGKPVKRVNNGHAGGISSAGYPVVYVDQWPYNAKEVVWEISNGKIPKGRAITPIDGDPLNCKIENLELNYIIPKDAYRYGEYLGEFLEYDEDSPSGLIWKKKYGKGSTVQIGGAAGSLDGGYWKVHAFGKNLKGHKIVWALHNNFENQDGLHIDHIDGNPSNNNINNLRLVPEELNARNKPMNRNNTSGIHGVSFQKVRTKNGNFVERYVATWYTLEGKRKTKCFSVNVYGDELAHLLVGEYRQHQIDLLNLVGAGYTDRHGT